MNAGSSYYSPKVGAAGPAGDRWKCDGGRARTEGDG
jgi:hypothetical protein